MQRLLTQKQTNSPRRDSNPQSLPPEGSALSIRPQGRVREVDAAKKHRIIVVDKIKNKTTTNRRFFSLGQNLLCVVPILSHETVLDWERKTAQPSPTKQGMLELNQLS